MKEGVSGKGQDEKKKLLPKHFWGQVLQRLKLPMCPSRTWGPDRAMPRRSPSPLWQFY